MHSFRFTISILFLLLLSSCQKDQTKDYLFIGHSYNWQAPGGDRVDPRVEALDLDAYDQIWLGGDICGRTSQKASTLDYLDDLFGISQNRTLWAIGNHDIKSGTPSLISKKTKRPFSYSQHRDGITYLVLNTNTGHPQLPDMDSSKICDALHQQFSLLKNIADTIQASSHLVVLHHHSLLTKNLVNGQKDLLDKWHFIAAYLKMSCTPHGTFEKLYYPLLTKIQQKGTQVVLIGGDLGQRAKRFEFQSKEGIWFLGSGINNSMKKENVPKYVTNHNPDSILVFQHDLKEETLKWEFRELGGF
ncbi:MAG: hypothetical protein AB8F74_21325 [Saprospiraceae bacterium]